MGRNYSKSIFGRLVKFGRSVLYLLGRLVKYSAVQFSIYSALWIRPTVHVRLSSDYIANLEYSEDLITDYWTCLIFQWCPDAVDAVGIWLLNAGLVWYLNGYKWYVLCRTSKSILRVTSFNAGELKVLVGTHGTDPTGLQGGEVGLEKHTKLNKNEKKNPNTV